MIKDSKVVVLNTADELVSEISWHRAVFLIHENKAYAKFSVPGVIVHSPSVSIPLPEVIVLINWVSENMSFLASDKATIPGVFKRDGFVCAYCGDHGNTIDHIYPKSRGGSNSWMNLITSCSPCNNLKADRTPEEAGMQLLFPPYDPSDRFRKRIQKKKRIKTYKPKQIKEAS